MLNIPIVIAAYNRVEPLKRLLTSLSNAHYTMDVKLIISIDGGDNSLVVDVANQFKWTKGEKQVKVQDNNIGLRDHILQCGRLTNEYDGIILFEDDIYVAPYFYSYAIQAHEKYKNDKSISGVALYSHQYNETACLPFKPIDDGADVFYMQVPCSWGQSWLRHQWQAFEHWYDLNKHLSLREDQDVPPNVRLWPETSWKKYYYKYMAENNVFFVYPRISLATNFSDPGVHHTGSNILQVSLLYGKKDYVFSEVNDSIAKYDGYSEILFESLNECISLPSIDECEIDMYGMKNKNDISKKYVLTTQSIKNPIKSFSRKLKPHELNICEDILGEDISLGLRDDMTNYGPFLVYRTQLNQDYDNTHAYHYSITKHHYLVRPRKGRVSRLKMIYYQTRGVLGRIKRFLLKIK